MNLVFDIGNSNIVCGVFPSVAQDYQLIKKFRIATPKSITTDELAFSIINLLKQNNIDPKKITESIFCSVVPNVNHNITKMMNLYFDLNIKEITHRFFPDFIITYNDLESLGIDRLINLKAGFTINEEAQIIIDLGTATTIDVITEKKKYLGGMIIPGIAIALDALVEKTSKLPAIELNYPENFLGNSTKECMQNGVYYFNALALEKIIEEIRKKYFSNQKIKVVLTGGLSKFIASNFKVDFEIIPELTLKGLKILFDEISKK